MDKIGQLVQTAFAHGATIEDVSGVLRNQDLISKYVPHYQEPEKADHVPYGEEFDEPDEFEQLDQQIVSRDSLDELKEVISQAGYVFKDTPEGLSPATGDTSEGPGMGVGTPSLASDDGADVGRDAYPDLGMLADVSLRPGSESLLNEVEITGAGMHVPQPPQPGQDMEFGGMDTLVSGFMNYNPMVSAIQKQMDRNHSIMNGEQDLPWDQYSPYSTDQIDRIAGYPLDLFSTSRSIPQTDRIKKQYDRDYYVDRVLSESGWEGVAASVAGGMTNPLYLVPYFGWGRSGGALRMGTEAATGELLTEGAFHAGLDYTRTKEESQFNVMAGAVFGSILGGIANRGRITPEQFNKAMDNLNEQMRLIDEAVDDAAPIKRTNNAPINSLKDDVPDVDRLEGTFKRTAAKITPLRILTSPVGAARKLGALLGEQTVVGTTRAAVETLIKRHDARLAKGINSLADNYQAYRFRNPQDRLSRMEFQEEVVRALRNGDAHATAEIQNAARILRREVLDPMRKLAFETGLIPKDENFARFAKSYFPRVYNHGKIQAERGNFIKDIGDWIHQNEPNINRREAHEAAREIIRKLEGESPLVQVERHRDIKVTAGALKGRTVSVPDNVLSKWLINEPDVVLRSWVKDLSTQIEFQRMFGDTSLVKQLGEVEDEWNRLIEQASKTNPKKATKLERQKQNDMEVLRALRDRLQNKYKIPDNPKNAWVQAGRAARNLNVLRLLGGMTISAIPDLARPLYHHHFASYGKAINALANSPEFRNMAKADLRRMGVGLDMVLNTRLRAIVEADYLPMHSNQVYAALDNMVTGSGGRYPDFGRLSLMSQWNTSLKTLAGVMSQDGLIRALGKNQINLKKLKQAGIDPEMAKRMKAEIDKHGTEHSGLRMANSDKWTDFEASELFESSILREVDATIVTPGVMDRPLWMSSEIGKVIGQIKSFGFAATNKQMLSGLNNFSGMFIQGSLSAITMGALAYTIKRNLAGRDPDDDTHTLLMRGINYSGVIGIGNEAIQFAAGGAQMAGIYKGDGNFRWARQGMWGSVLGPSAGMVEDGMRAGRTFFKEDPNAGDVKALRAMLPYNNLFYTRMLFDEAEQMTKDNLRIPD